jgi:biotin carboxyl carrier protein
MKTQQPFLSPFDGTVTVIGAGKGDQVAEGQLLLKVEKA